MNGCPKSSAASRRHAKRAPRSAGKVRYVMSLTPTRLNGQPSILVNKFGRRSRPDLAGRLGGVGGGLQGEHRLDLVE